MDEIGNIHEQIHAWLTSLSLGPTAVMVLIAGALLEYVFPPFPGDTVVLAGAFLVGAAGWDPVVVLVAVNVGSLGGIVLDYGFGVYVQRHDQQWRQRWTWWNSVGRSIDRILPLFRKHPNFYLVCNRFLPSIRALFFVAAGMSEQRLWKVLLFGGLSAFLWCLLIFGVGWWIGSDWERLVYLFTQYQRVAWVVVAAVVIALCWRVWRTPEPAD